MWSGHINKTHQMFWSDNTAGQKGEHERVFRDTLRSEGASLGWLGVPLEELEEVVRERPVSA